MGKNDGHGERGVCWRLAFSSSEQKHGRTHRLRAQRRPRRAQWCHSVRPAHPELRTLQMPGCLFREVSVKVVQTWCSGNGTVAPDEASEAGNAVSVDIFNKCYRQWGFEKMEAKAARFRSREPVLPSMVMLQCTEEYVGLGSKRGNQWVITQKESPIGLLRCVCNLRLQKETTGSEVAGLERADCKMWSTPAIFLRLQLFFYQMMRQTRFNGRKPGPGALSQANVGTTRDEDIDQSRFRLDRSCQASPASAQPRRR
jgi:hypothetical protein